MIDELTKAVLFYGEAKDKGIVEPRIAYLAAKEGDLIDDNDNIDYEALKATHPVLFDDYPRYEELTEDPAYIPSYAGSGTDTPPPKTMGMNDYMRRLLS